MLTDISNVRSSKIHGNCILCLMGSSTSLNCINQLLSVLKTQSIYCAVGTELRL